MQIKTEEKNGLRTDTIVAPTLNEARAAALIACCERPIVRVLSTRTPQGYKIVLQTTESF